MSSQITAAEQNGYGFLLSLQKLIAGGQAIAKRDRHFINTRAYFLTAGRH